ncbi:protein patched homolog 1-like isoform X2 [Dreissena polymorpha]|uniref:protein patched homolog 1-like isoform X2 n=1 Tax=Dreissena polymorpha TaxID=45954 RepID=UPI002263FBB5|nr:protein patched homolog 1-like isoform X2 [Dreissena polymorpha]
MASERKKRSSKYVDQEYHDRPSYVNAKAAYRQIRKGKADGNKHALWVRKHVQEYLYIIGIFINQHCGKVCFVGLLLLSLCCVGLKSVKMETDVEKLWVEEGGRLEEELTYSKDHIGAGAGITNQILIQTPKSGNNILSKESLLQHRDALVKASQITVEMFDIKWRYTDICYLAQFPLSESSVLESMLVAILPCVIITPLDCFWEGSQALGPPNGIKGVHDYFKQLLWTNLNPMEIVGKLKNHYEGQTKKEMEALEKVFRDAGVTTGYQEKPCIDPKDYDCPATAPNKQSLNVPDFGAELTNGCYGFATKYMHWHEDLIVGGLRKNQTGHIVRAEALQSILLLLGEQHLYDKYSKDIKTANIDWTLEKARMILEEWHRKFTKEMNAFAKDDKPDNQYAFSMTSLMDIIKDFSDISVVRVTIGYVLMLFYAFIILLRWNNMVLSQSGIGIAGVLLVALSVAAGLGICSLLGIKFNASTTQIIPFLALGLGVNDMFLITHSYTENANKDNIPHKEQTAECLKRTGTTILLTSVSNMLAFFSAVIIPIPALRSFVIQAGILILFNLVSVIFIYPAICSIDLIRRKNKKCDIFCCFESYADNDVVIELQPHINDHNMMERSASPPPVYTPRTAYSPPPYSDLLAHDMITEMGAIGGPTQTTLAPSEGQFVTRCGSPIPGFDSATNSRQCLTDGENVTWLQAAFDREYVNGTFSAKGWPKNASADTKLAYTLLVQTGDVDNSIDTDQITSVRLVSKEGIINPAAFYNYLTVWISNDALAYSYSMGEIRPETQTWPFDPDDFNLQVPKAKNIAYAQIPFYLSKLSNSDDILDVVLKIRQICDDFTSRGLLNYPVGVPFTFWEQYIQLRFYLMMALLCIMGVTFVVLSVTLMNPWMAGIIIVILTLILVELFGFMGIMGLKLSAIPAVILIVTVGMGVEFTVHLAVGFLSSIGTRDSRMAMALEHTFSPVFHGGISTFLGVIMLAGAEFDFIVRYFFIVLTALVLIGLLNGLLLLPVLLSICGPPSEVRPKKDTDRIPTPSPEASPKARIRNLPVRATRSSRKMKFPRRIPSDISLTTITEEPSQYSSTEIVVQPEVVVETSIPKDGRSGQQTAHKMADDTSSRHSSQSRNSSTQGTMLSTPPTHHVTRVKATATVKVEVHTPIPGTVPDSHEYKRRRRKDDTDSDSESSSSSSS